MKRYVKEFANEFLSVKNYPEEKKDKILKIVRFAENGMITSYEAVTMIVKVVEDFKKEVEK